MKFTLSDIDTIYREHIKILDAKVRISYCESIIDNAETSLNRKANINSELNTYLHDILLAAKNELKAILNKSV